MADTQTAPAGGIPAGAPVQQTPIAPYHPTDCTVQFVRWTAFQNTAYMRGQQAGFTNREAAMLVQMGAAILVQQTDRTARVGRAVNKGAA